MPKQKTIYQKLTDLAKEYSDYSLVKFGWQRTYIQEKDGVYQLNTSYDTEVGYLYFAESNDHRSVTLEDVQISFFSTAKINFKINADLKTVLKKYTEILEKIKQFHDQESIEEEEARKQEYKDSLLRQLESLK